MTRRHQCFKCKRIHCYVRIYSADYSYDEVACSDHVRDLESDAQEASKMGEHMGFTSVSGSYTLRRGGP